MKLFLKYILQHRFSIIMFCVFSAIFLIIFSLYDLEAEAVGYAIVLCLSIIAIILPGRYIKFRKNYLARQALLDNMLLTTEQLPEPASPLEGQYIEMIEQLRTITYENQNRYNQERNDSIDYYTAWVHQIKIPISVMQMILQSEDTEAYHALSAELFRIEQYIEMVLYRFRLDSSANDFVFETVSLDKIIRMAIRKYAPLFIRKKIKIIYNGTDAVVLSDEKWLLFMIEQLLSNAIKYTKNGSVSISVTDSNILTVTDTGIGIAAEDLPRIFEKGYTGYNGRADKKSTGLGLYLCHRAADKLSHKLCAKSKVGKGSTFYIDLNTIHIQME